MLQTEDSAKEYFAEIRCDDTSELTRIIHELIEFNYDFSWSHVRDCIEVRCKDCAKQSALRERVKELAPSAQINLVTIVQQIITEL